MIQLSSDGRVTKVIPDYKIIKKFGEGEWVSLSKLFFIKKLGVLKSRCG